MKRIDPTIPEPAEQSADIADPLAAFLADPESHLSDLLYLNFRIYKKQLLWRFMEKAIAALKVGTDSRLAIADVGASMGFDALYLLRRWTNHFRAALPCRSVALSLIEGDAGLIERGTQTLRRCLANTAVTFEYHHHPMVEALPLAEASQDLAICSEVVEHLEHPKDLLGEIFRILRPGGFLILTTDNSPNLLQRLRRVPVWFSGQYEKVYARPSLASEIVGTTEWNGREYPIYGHINLNPTRHWERLSREAGFVVADYGTYESIRRGGGARTPWTNALYFLIGGITYYLLPRRLGRFMGDTTALLLQKPQLQHGGGL